MTVLYLHQYFNTPEMAGGTRSYEMARRLVNAGHKVRLLTTWREPTDRTDWFVTNESGIEVHWLPVPYSNRMGFSERLKAFLRFAWSAGRRAARLSADVVFATSTPLTIALPGYYASRRQRIPLVFEVRDLWPEVPVAMGVLRNPLLVRLAFMLERFAYRSSTRIVALAPGMKRSICQRGIPEETVSVIPNGCDLDVFGTRSGPVPADLAGSARSIIYAGTIGLANGVEYVPRLAHELEQMSCSQPVRFHVIGDGARRAAVEAEASRLGVLNRSVFFLGRLPKREVARWVEGGEATIMTYAGPEIVYRDSVSNKFFDSLAAGKPVLANFRGFSTTLAEQAGAGFILDNDPKAAAAELCRLVESPETFSKAGAAALQLARDHFSRDALAAELERVLLDAVDRTGR